MTTVRLAFGGPISESLSGKLEPAMLVSYFYLPLFLKQRDGYTYRDWSLDSGAFSAKNSGKTIDLDRYIADCQQLLEEDPKLVEVFSLDVIGDYKGTRANTEKMWAEGVEAIPTFHVGTPWDELVALAKEYPKIALGGAVGLGTKQKSEWVGQCFARVWPKAMHGFGMCAEKMIMSYPFASVDATNWELGPCAFGHWKTFGKMSVRSKEHRTLKTEIKHYLELEARARVRWRRELARIAPGGPVVRLADIGTGRMRRSNPND